MTSLHRQGGPFSLSITLSALLCGYPALGQEALLGDAASRGPEPSSEAAVESAQDVAVRVISENVRALMASEAYAKAVSELERLLRKAPERSTVHLLAVQIYFRLGQDDEVKQHANRASELDPDSAEPYRWLARLARWRGALKEARRHLSRALEREPESTALRTELASLYEAEGHTFRARRHYRRALTGEPNDPDAALEAALRLGEPERRNQALRQLSQRFPDHARIRSWTALCEQIEGLRFWQADPHLSPVSVPMRVDAQHLASVEVDIGARETIRVLLDTGTSGLKLSRQAAEAAGVQTFGALYIGGLGSEGLSRADLGLLTSMRLGALNLRNIPVTVLDSLPYGAGLLNPRAIGTEAVRFDVSNRMLHLGDRTDLVSEQGRPHRFIEVEEHPLFRLYLNGQPRQAMLDSGSGATILDVSVVRQMPERRPMLFEGIDFKLSGVLGEVEEARPVHVSRLGFGKVVVEDSILFEADLSSFGAYLGTDVQLLLGADYFTRFDTTLDYRSMKLIQEPASHQGRRRFRPVR